MFWGITAALGNNLTIILLISNVNYFQLLEIINFFYFLLFQQNTMIFCRKLIEIEVWNVSVTFYNSKC